MANPEPAARGRRARASSGAGDGFDAALADRALADLGARALPRDHPDYPAALLDLSDPPRVLYLRGTPPPLERSIAVVGSRAASTYGIEQATRLAADLAGLGLAVVSGLARGIDAAAHRGALDAGGSSVAVLPSSFDNVTPPDHRDLAEEIAGSGAWVSEIAPGTGLTRAMFVKRNRLIAALAAVTVVVQAATRSGALATAAAARRLGRPLLAFPGDVDRPESRGCHALLRAGALLCESAADVVRALGDGAATAGGVEGRLLAALRAAPLSVESLAVAAGVPVDRTLAALVQLEWSGLARACPGQRWARETA